MTVIVLRCILICLFIANVVEAAVPWRPPTKQLSQEELEPILRACLKKKKLSERLMFTFTHWSS